MGQVKEIVLTMKVESGKEGVLWGSVNYDGNLVVDSGTKLKVLVIKMKSLLFTLHRVRVDRFIIERF